MSAHHVRPYGANVTAKDRTPDGTGGASDHGHDGIQQYQIRVKGHLGSRWSAWFDGLTLTSDDDGTTVIHGPVVDQAALHGLLQKLRDVGIPLISLRHVPPDAAAEPPALDDHEGQ